MQVTERHGRELDTIKFIACAGPDWSSPRVSDAWNGFGERPREAASEALGPRIERFHPKVSQDEIKLRHGQVSTLGRDPTAALGVPTAMQIAVERSAMGYRSPRRRIRRMTMIETPNQ